MKLSKLFAGLLLSMAGIFAQAQNINVSIQVFDETSDNPVSNAHVFLEDSSFGVITDQKGQATLVFPDDLTGDIVISHISYETFILPHRVYKNYTSAAAVNLSPNGFEMDALIISADRSRKWKKQFKKFQKAFLGTDEQAKKCEILNPEVLRFEDSSEGFNASAIDFIHIKNAFLGYEVFYLLNELEISSNGSVEYSGKSLFLDRIDDYNPEEITANRKRVYLNSPKHFFKSLIDNRLEEDGYKLKMVKYVNGQFYDLNSFIRDDFLTEPISSGIYKLGFDEFLQVYNENSKYVTFGSGGVRQGGLESDKFSGSIKETKEQVHFDVSYLYKISPHILLNRYGNILNSDKVREYGVWAEQKLAYQLPYEYGNDTAHYNNVGDEIAESIPSKESVQDEKLERLKSLIYEEGATLENLEEIRLYWEDGFAAPLFELLRVVNDASVEKSIKDILSEKYNLEKISFYDGMQWLWKQNFPNEDYYYDFKAEIYSFIDPRFKKYFLGRKQESSIELDEVLWGGVEQDGIPPLRNPAMLPVDEAQYLSDTDIIFGLYIDGQAFAYPKRILAWHEFLTDSINGQNIACVYCTLCGTVMVYRADLENKNYDLGTSGFLYRSNKLMYDQETQSLWNSIEGRPVIGPLVGKGIQLESLPVVTTNWASWKKKHPKSKVLSTDTGYARDYSEGAAYKDYFSTDQLMFPVLKLDNRLKNKDEVVVVRDDRFKDNPLAVSKEYMSRKKLFMYTKGSFGTLFLCDESGSVRAYDAGAHHFNYYKNGELRDSEGHVWIVEESQLRSDKGSTLKRLAAHNIFWFAWYNMHPETRLVK
jgi:hypothetical protein